MGAPLFLRLYSMLNHGRNSESFKFIISPDVNLRVWNVSEFNKSKISFEECSRCSRCSLLHIQKIFFKRYMKCLYFSLKLIGLPGCLNRFWKTSRQPLCFQLPSVFNTKAINRCSRTALYFFSCSDKHTGIYSNLKIFLGER